MAFESMFFLQFFRRKYIITLAPGSPLRRTAVPALNPDTHVASKPQRIKVFRESPFPPKKICPRNRVARFLVLQYTKLGIKYQMATTWVYQMAIKKSNGRKVKQMVLKDIKIFHKKAFHNLPTPV
jgi:hypothetical protein